MNPVTKLPRVRITSPLLSGLLNALITLVLGAVVLSMLLAWTDMKEQSLSLWAYVVHALASCFGGMGSGKRAVSKGWYHGGLLGLLYSVLVVLAGFLGADAEMKFETLIVPAVSLFGGMLGGMIGVNRK